MSVHREPREDEPWRVRFFVILIGQSVSLFGSFLTQFVLIWWLTLTTGSASVLAAAGIAAMLPQGVLGIFAGVVADRYDRRLIMILTDAITALCMVILVILFAVDRVALWHIYTLMAIRSAMQAFQSPAAAASTAMLVPTSWLSRAVGMNQLVMGLCSIVAAPAAALALALLPLQWALMIDVSTALLGIVPLFFFAIPQTRVVSQAARSMWSDTRAGVRVVFGHRGLAAMWIINVLMLLTIMPAFAMAPLLVQQYFHAGVNAIAVMEGGGGAGVVVGGLIASVMAFRQRRVTVMLVTFALSCATVALAALMPASMFWMAVFWWFVSGVTYAIGMVPSRAILQTVVPNHYQGRVLSLFMMVWALAGPIGLALFGPLADAYGVRAVFIGGGILATLACVLGFASYSLRNIESTPVDIPDVIPDVSQSTVQP
ncbi:MAG: MFS transporter [Thermomicrobiales bacterium]|nr:MFS transporter [Thermomicrobiales bacterium]